MRWSIWGIRPRLALRRSGTKYSLPVLLAPFAAAIPLVALTTVLFHVAWNMADLPIFLNLLRRARVLLCGLNPRVADSLRRAGVLDLVGTDDVCARSRHASDPGVRATCASSCA
jgi:hypothetical protein